MPSSASTKEAGAPDRNGGLVKLVRRRTATSIAVLIATRLGKDMWLSVCVTRVDALDLHSFPTRRSSDLVVRRCRVVCDSDQRRRHHAGAHRPGCRDRKSTRLTFSHSSIPRPGSCLNEQEVDVATDHV